MRKTLAKINDEDLLQRKIKGNCRNVAVLYQDYVKLHLSGQGGEWFTYIDYDTYYRILQLKLTWRATKIRNGKVYAFTIVTIKKQQFKLYLSKFVIKNTAEGYVTDHLNGDSLDNRKINLKEMSQKDNLRNKTGYNNATGYRGVAKCKESKSYQAAIRHNGKSIYLGVYSTAEKAAIAWNNKAIELGRPERLLNKV